MKRLKYSQQMPIPALQTHIMDNVAQTTKAVGDTVLNAGDDNMPNVFRPVKQLNDVATTEQNMVGNASGLGMSGNRAMEYAHEISSGNAGWPLPESQQYIVAAENLILPTSYPFDNVAPLVIYLAATNPSNPQRALGILKSIVSLHQHDVAIGVLPAAVGVATRKGDVPQLISNISQSIAASGKPEDIALSNNAMSLLSGIISPDTPLKQETDESYRQFNRMREQGYEVSRLWANFMANKSIEFYQAQSKLLNLLRTKLGPAINSPGAQLLINFLLNTVVSAAVFKGVMFKTIGQQGGMSTMINGGNSGLMTNLQNAGGEIMRAIGASGDLGWVRSVYAQLVDENQAAQNATNAEDSAHQQQTGNDYNLINQTTQQNATNTGINFTLQQLEIAADNYEKSLNSIHNNLLTKYSSGSGNISAPTEGHFQGIGASPNTIRQTAVRMEQEASAYLQVLDKLASYQLTQLNNSSKYNPYSQYKSIGLNTNYVDKIAPYENIAARRSRAQGWKIVAMMWGNVVAPYQEVRMEDIKLQGVKAQIDSAKAVGTGMDMGWLQHYIDTVDKQINIITNLIQTLSGFGSELKDEDQKYFYEYIIATLDSDLKTRATLIPQIENTLPGGNLTTANKLFKNKFIRKSDIQKHNDEEKEASVIGDYYNNLYQGTDMDGYGDAIDKPKQLHNVPTQKINPATTPRRLVYRRVR